MKKRLSYFQYLGFFTIGLVSNIIGPLLPAIRAEMPMSYGQSGLLLSGMWPGLILAVLVGGYLSDKYGTKLLLLAGGVALSLGLVGSMASGSHWVLLSWMILSGVGFGAFEIGINVWCSVSNDSNKGNALNFLHFFFGLGAIFGPILSTVCLELLNNWRVVFGVSAILPLVVIVMLSPLRIEKHYPAVPAESKPVVNKRLLWICGVLIFAYVGIEVSIQGWLAVFWGKIAQSGFIPVSLIGSFFWVSLTIGRLISGRVADRFGLAKFLTTVSLGSIVLALVWVFAHSAWNTLILILLLGFLLAGIYPTQMALTTVYYPGMTGMVTSFITGVGSLGALFIPSAFGKLADWIGIQQLPVIILGLATVMFAFAKYQEIVAKGLAGGKGSSVCWRLLLVFKSLKRVRPTRWF